MIWIFPIFALQKYKKKEYGLLLIKDNLFFNKNPVGYYI